MIDDEAYMGPADADFKAKFTMIMKMAPSEYDELTRREVGSYIKFYNEMYSVEDGEV